MAWGSCRKDSIHIKTASSDMSSGSVDESSSWAMMTNHQRHSSSHSYYVQTPSEMSYVQRPHSLELSRPSMADEHHPWITSESAVSWDKIALEEPPIDEDGDGGRGRGGYHGSNKWRGFEVAYPIVVRVLVVVLVVFTVGLMSLWAGVRRTYKPRILVQDMVFKDLSIQQGLDLTGVPTEMMSLNATVKVSYNKPATFFRVHVSSTPFLLHHYGLKLATGQMEQLYQSKKSEESLTTVVMRGQRMPLYGVLLALRDATVGDIVDNRKVKIGLNLTFTLRSKANIFGKLVKFKLFTSIICPVTLDGGRLRKPIDLTHSCIYL